MTMASTSLLLLFSLLIAGSAFGPKTFVSAKRGIRVRPYSAAKMAPAPFEGKNYTTIHILSPLLGIFLFFF